MLFYVGGFVYVRRTVVAYNFLSNGKVIKSVLGKASFFFFFFFFLLCKKAIRTSDRLFEWTI